jgi:hypothetical protein
LESIKHFLWHGNTPEAMERLTGLSIPPEHDPGAFGFSCKDRAWSGRLRDLHQEQAASSFPTSAIDGGREKGSVRISTAFVESTINQVVSRRFLKKQQMQWTLRGAHLLLQARTKVLNNELEGTFRQWYPRFRPKAA